MRKRLALMAFLLLPACKTPAPTPVEPRASKAPAVASARPASPTPAPALLVPPASAGATLTGVVKLDANHVVAQGGGNIISNDGGSLITNDGGSLAVDSGNAIITNDGGSLITNDGGSIISTNGGDSIITNDGGSLITNDGGSIISNDGASAKGYALLATNAPAPGTQLPVAGAQVAVRSLGTGKLLPIGQDADGKPVTRIYTNAKGAFTLYLPKDLAENVRIETALPSARGAQRYNVLTDVAAGQRQLDEDSQLVTAYMEEAYADRMTALLTTPADKLQASGLIAPLAVPLQPFREAAAPLLGNPAKLRELGARAAHLMLAQPGVPYGEPNYGTDDFGPDLLGLARTRNEERHLNRAFDVAVDMMGTVRRAVAKRMALEASGAAYFDQLGPVAAYRKVLAPNFHIRYATDFPLFLVRAYLSSDLRDGGGNPFGEGLRYNGVARLLEAEAPRTDVPIPAAYAGLFLAATAPDAPPRLTASYTGPDALGPDFAIPRGEAVRLDTASRAVNAALVAVLFGSEHAKELQSQLLAVIEDVKAHP